MLSLEDIIDFSALTEGEIDAIAEHEHISEISAASLGQSLLQSRKGTEKIERFIREDMEEAEWDGLTGKAKGLQQVLARFMETRPFPGRAIDLVGLLRASKPKEIVARNTAIRGCRQRDVAQNLDHSKIGDLVESISAAP
jgi:hypothetical protein